VKRIILAFLIWLAPALACAQMLTLGAGPGGFATAYVPQAVAFIPEVSLIYAGAMTTTDTGYGIHSACLRSSTGIPAGNTSAMDWSIQNVDVISNQGAVGTNGSENLPGDDFAVDDASGTTGTLRFNYGDSSAATTSTNVVEGELNSSFPTDTWNCYLWAYDVAQSTGNKHFALYINGVLQSPSFNEQGTVPSIVTNITQSHGFGINGNSGNGNVGASGAFEIADVLVDWHHATDAGGTNWLTYLDANNALPATTVARFFSAGRPVDIGGQSGAGTCSKPLGTQPDLCFSGNTSTFATNKGSIPNSFVLTGPDSANHVLYNAALSPVGPQDAYPYVYWNNVQQVTGLSSSSSSFQPTNQGNPIAVGDLLLLVVQSSENGTNVNRAFTTSSTGWSAPSNIPSTDNNGTGGYVTNTAVFSKVATANDVTAAMGTWNATYAPTITWTTNSATVRSLYYELFDYKQASTIQASGITASTSNSTNIVSPTLTPTSVPSILVTLSCVYGITDTGIIKAPSGKDVRFKSFSGAVGTSATCMNSDEKLSSTSATGTRTATVATARPPVGASLVIGP
jgi:hypothetical protein